MHILDNRSKEVKYALKHMAQSFKIFSRLGRCGCCAGCPVDVEGNIYPEFCENTEMYDHNLDIDWLASAWKNYSRKESEDG
jgi:hypothetical protein